MAKGTVKWFNSAKGYGFICSAQCEQDVFAHFSSIVMDGYKTLKAGQPVCFEVNEGPKGLHAINIRPDTESERDAASEELEENEEKAMA
ncbi:MAG TPA: cold shock domain-containing protein [Gammaproteobacteria bacterium]|nr:cold shock domain-containing protein [Gammaproteobacteria bacterium]